MYDYQATCKFIVLYKEVIIRYQSHIVGYDQLTRWRRVEKLKNVFAETIST